MTAQKVAAGNGEINGETRVAGVWGYPVRHSASPAMHNAAFRSLGLNWVYVPFTVEPTPASVARAVDGVRALDLAGVNVTVPLKERVVPYLDALTDRAARLGAVNTIRNEGGHLTGDSTDGTGFLSALEYAGFVLSPHMRVVVLGAGGSARAIVDALVHAGTHVTLANRSPARADALAAELGAGRADVTGWDAESIGNALGRAGLLVNTTSLGMSPSPDTCPPVPVEAFTANLWVSDLVYNPAQTLLMRRAEEGGCRVQNGTEMLVRQGGVAFKWWTGRDAPTDIMRRAVEEFLATRRP